MQGWGRNILLLRVSQEKGCASDCSRVCLFTRRLCHQSNFVGYSGLIGDIFHISVRGDWVFWLLFCVLMFRLEQALYMVRWQA